MSPTCIPVWANNQGRRGDPRRLVAECELVLACCGFMRGRWGRRTMFRVCSLEMERVVERPILFGTQWGVGWPP